MKTLESKGQSPDLWDAKQLVWYQEKDVREAVLLLKSEISEVREYHYDEIMDYIKEIFGDWEKD